MPFNARITPWSIGFVLDVVFGGRKTNSTAIRPVTFVWTGQLSIIITILWPSVSNLASSSFHTTVKDFSIHPESFFWALGRLLTPLKQRGVTDIPITNIAKSHLGHFLLQVLLNELCWISHQFNFHLWHYRYLLEAYGRTSRMHQHWNCLVNLNVRKWLACVFLPSLLSSLVYKTFPL